MSEDGTYLVRNGRPRIRAHPAADCWPLGDVEKTAESIRARGQQYPVKLFPKRADQQQNLDEALVLDGRTRLLAMELLGDEPEFEWVSGDPVEIAIACNEDRKHLNDSQRAMVAARLANLRKGRPSKGNASIDAVSQPVAAARMHVSRPTVQRAAAIVDDSVLAPAVEDGTLAVSDAASIRNEPPEVKKAAVEAVKESKGKMTAKRAAKKVTRERRQEEAREAAKTTPMPPNLIVSAVADLRRHVGPGSVDAIVTDPPYLTEHVEAGVYMELGAFAEHALRPGGLLLCICPHLFIDVVIGQMRSEQLRYRWLMCYLKPQARQHVDSAHVTCKWQPWSAFTRAGAGVEGYSRDAISAGRFVDGDKEFHLFGQRESGVEAVIAEWVKKPGSVVCDPFSGGGAFPAAAKALGHRVIAADADPACVEETRRRLEES